MKEIRVNILRLGIVIGNVLLNIVYMFLKLLPSKNKVVMLSRQSNQKNIDFNLIEEEIKNRKPKIEVVVLCKILKKDIKERIKYCMYILKCMYHIATAKICVLDGYSIPISLLNHKKNLKIIQIWHASGAIKKFGYQTLDKKEGRGKKVAQIMKMHKNYSYVVAPSKTTAQFYEEAFGIESEKIIINNLPRIDYLLSEATTELKEKYNTNKKTILYVPTYRKDSDNIKIIKEIEDNIDFSKYNLIIKLHPLDQTICPQRYIESSKYNTYDLIKIADYIITDYSAVAFDVSVIGKPLYFYIYDINEYKKARGLNINLQKEMKEYTKKDIKEIIKLIDSQEYDYQELDKFKEKYMGNNYHNNTKKIVDFIFECLGVRDDNKRSEKDDKITSDEFSKEKLSI